MREVVYEGLSKHVSESRENGEKKYSQDQYKSLQKSLHNLRKENKGLKIKYDKVSGWLVLTTYSGLICLQSQLIMWSIAYPTG